MINPHASTIPNIAPIITVFPSAILYSLVETAKANTINTFEYFNLLLTEIPRHMDDKDLRFIDDLLPWSPRVQKEGPSRYKKS